MAIESAPNSRISELNAANPDGASPKSNGDNHLRLIKTVLKATFPKSGPHNAIAAENVQRRGTLNWDLLDKPNIKISLTGNINTLNPVNGQDGGVYTALFTQDGTGSRTVAWPSSWLWTEGDAGTVSSAANSKTLLTIRYVGSDVIAAPLMTGLA